MILNPPKDVRKIDLEYDAPNLGNEILEGISVINTKNEIPELGKAKLIYGLNLPINKIVTKRHIERRIQLFKPFFQEIDPLPNEQPLIMLRYKLVDNYVNEDAISTFLTLLANKVSKGTIIDEVQAVSEEFQLDLKTAKEKISKWYSNKDKFQSILKETQQLLKKAEHGICFTGTTKEVLRKEVKKLPRLQPFERMILFWQLLKKMSVSSEFILLNPRQTIETGLHKHQKRLQEIFAYVEHHYHEDVDMKKVAGIAHLSIPSFCNYFKKIMHCTFTDFLNKYRIQKASMLLQQDKTVTEVCYECGFNNVSYFNKVFKDITHQTPSAFRHNFLQTERMAS